MSSSFFYVFLIRMKTIVGRRTIRRRVLTLMDGFFSLFIPFLLLTVVRAQPGSPPNDNQFYNARFSPSMAIIIVVLIAALFFMGFFSIYIRHCSDASGAGGSVRRALSMRNRRAAAARGLDASVLETFPTFPYSEVKDHKIGKGALECAVCLNEFEENETLRLLGKCDHVFHQECIDAWLESHVTCPVCRANLVPQAGDEQVQIPVSSNDDAELNENVERTNSNIRSDEIVVQVDEDQRQDVNRRSSFEYLNRTQRSWSVRRPKIFGFSKFRSHSTGHSLVQPGENLDRFTLRLPAELRKEMMDRASLNRTGSHATTLPREGSSRRGYRTGGGEGSSRAGRSYRRMEKLDTGTKSDRWIFFTRGLSMRSPKVVAETGEGSASKGSGRRMPVRLPSFNCLEPKSSDETTRPLSHDPAPPPPPRPPV